MYPAYTQLVAKWSSPSIGDARATGWVIGGTGSVEGIYAFIYCTKWRSGRVSRMPDGLTRNFER